MEEALLTLAEVSLRTRVPVATLRFWRSREPQKGPHTFRLGSRVVAKASDVDAWIERQYQASEAAGGAA